jgi:hypothetical protein
MTPPVAVCPSRLSPWLTEGYFGNSGPLTQGRKWRGREFSGHANPLSSRRGDLTWRFISQRLFGSMQLQVEMDDEFKQLQQKVFR